MGRLMTLHTIIRRAWLKSGHAGEPTVEFVRNWRATHAAYGDWTLGVLFAAGSALPVGIETALDLAAAEYRRLHPDHVGPVAGDGFEALYAKIRTDREALEIATETPVAKGRRERHQACAEEAQAQGRPYRQGRNREEVGAGRAMPFPDDGTGE